MEYCLEMCSTYTPTTIGEKNIYVFDSHNMALPVWGTVSSRSQSQLNLVTFDTHADTRNPFSRFLASCSSEINRDYMHNPNVIELLKNFHYMRTDFCFENVWSISIESIANDEHIQTAYDWGYLASYTVVCALSHSECMEYQENDIANQLSANYFSRDEWHTKRDVTINRLNGKPIALDFDLDYFRCPSDADDRFWDSVEPLVEQSSVITIAREPEWFNRASQDDSFTNQIALNTVLENIKRIIEAKA